MTPLDAVTHPDPYPYYARLAAETPLYRDEALGMWVAASAAAVTAVLEHSAARVRPPAAPTPPLVAQLARLTDGEAHRNARAAVDARLAGLTSGLHTASPASIRACADRWSQSLASMDLTAFTFALPSYVIGSLLGVADDELAELAQHVSALVRYIFPGGTAEQIERGRQAAAAIRLDPSAIGLLTQAHDATAGLIAAGLVRLARGEEADLDYVVRFDPPVQNTRRFIAAPATILGRTLAEGDAVLVLLAAANRDPGAEGRIFTFGVGPHACPGQALATTIAESAIAQLLAGGLDPRRLDTSPSYRPSLNCRIPKLTWKDERP